MEIHCDKQTNLNIIIIIHLHAYAFPDGIDILDVTKLPSGPSGPIFMDKIDCSGEETSLSECSYSEIHKCSHSNDVGIICYRK